MGLPRHIARLVGDRLSSFSLIDIDLDTAWGAAELRAAIDARRSISGPEVGCHFWRRRPRQR